MSGNLYTTARPGSFASTIRTGSSAGCRIALLGLPDDTGVAMNGGRVGAKDGPRAFRDALSRYGSTTYLDNGKAIEISDPGVFDAGDVSPGESLEKTHDRVADRVRELLDLNLLPVCIGGGHDLTWPAVRAVAERFPTLAGVYFDAHLDVREEAGSGMPFRKILTETPVRELHIVGIDPCANRREHVEWFTSHGGQIASDNRPVVRADRRFVSFDLDVLDASAAPGVSATNPVGMPSTEAAAAMYRCGSDPEVVYVDIMELNPKYDIDGRTARLAARLFLSFVAGYAQRG